jgi:histidine triad (HIT) family protein
MAHAYDSDNIFAKILRGEIPNRTLLETDHSLAFHDIQPQAPVHVLVIPKGPYVSFDHFAAEASEAEIVDFNRSIAKACEMTEVAEGGFRLIANAGFNGVQEVPHLHVHVLGGRPLGRMLTKA